MPDARRTANRARLIEENKNAWRVAPATRMAFLIDAAAYFDAVADTIERAQQSIFILAWDINSDVVLRRSDAEAQSSSTLGNLLQHALEAHRELQIYVLTWDFAMLYAFERDLLPLFNLAWSRDRRLHFRMDACHPLGACHHQKIVVVDDAVAFVGGLDLTKNRWDTPQHSADDPRRVDTGGQAYEPFHDIQMMVDGKAAKLLAELARGRWHRATGQALPQTARPNADVWPPSIEPDLKNEDVAIARTYPAYGDTAEIREIEQLYLDGVEAAESSIYIENQYFTSSKIAGALMDRLREPSGPDVVAVLPRRCTGWLEENTMGLLRSKALQKLFDSDKSHRFRAYYPVVPAAEPCDVFVHSKIMIIDDRLILLGSANLSNRSMGLDSECNLAVESRGNKHAKEAIARLRHRLLAEHLGVSVSECESKWREHGSLVAVVEALRGKKRTLEPLEEPEVSEWAESLASSVSAVDPERAIGPEDLVEQFLPSTAAKPLPRWGRAGFILLGLLGLAAIWRWTPLREVADVETLQRWGEEVSTSSVAPAIVLAAYLIGGLIMMPITVLIFATALTFHPVTALAYSTVGALASAALTYSIGQALGRDALRRMAGSKLNRLSRRLAQKGLIAMAALRLVPVAPFTVVNLVAGASHIQFRDFLLGSLIGLLPGIAGITVLENRIEAVIRAPGTANVGVLMVVALVVLGGIFWVRRRFGSN